MTCKLVSCLSSLFVFQKQVMDAEELFAKYHGDPFVLQLIAYALAMEHENLKTVQTSGGPSDLYCKSPSALIKLALISTDSSSDEDDGNFGKALRKYLLILADFVQAKTLEDLGKGRLF